MTERDRHEGRVSLSHWYAAPIFNRCPASAPGRSGILASALSLGQRGYGHAARGVAESAVVSDVVHAGSARAAALLAPLLSSRCQHCSCCVTPLTLATERSLTDECYYDRHAI